jgi:hypothetical protein
VSEDEIRIKLMDCSQFPQDLKTRAASRQEDITCGIGAAFAYDLTEPDRDEARRWRFLLFDGERYAHGSSSSRPGSPPKQNCSLIRLRKRLNFTLADTRSSSACPA